MVATATGWTYDTIGDMSLPDLLGLLSYWRTTPPTHVVLAARYLKPVDGESEMPARRAQPHDPEADFYQAQAFFGPAKKKMEPHIAAMFDWAAAMSGKKRNG